MRHLLFLVLVACGSTSQTLAPDVPVAPDSSPASDASDGPSSLVDPATDGIAQVTESTAAIPGSANRTVQASLFVPMTAGMHPLVVISPGFQMDRAQYESFARHLATWDFVVVLASYADTGFSVDHQAAANDISKIIDWAIANQPVDATAIGAAGHSLGGKLSIFAASQDPRIGAVVGWDPVDSNNPSVAPEKMTTMTTAIAVIGETTDGGGGGGMACAPAVDNFKQFYAAAPSPALAITAAGADHMDWVDDPTCFLCGFCSTGTANIDVIHTATRRLDVAWFRRHLRNDTSMDSWLLTPPEQGLAVEHR